MPEYLTRDTPVPVVFALHGGSGHGRVFLWSWLREARSRGVILVAPTASGDTWSLMEPDVDGAHLSRVLDYARERWPVDPTKLLLSGMSDGGTFTLLSGLDSGSPFTHLAPVAASFHPLLVTMTEPERIRGLPVYLVHGALDWMFPIADRTHRQSGVDDGGSERRVPGDRGFVAHLSARRERCDPGLVHGGLTHLETRRSTRNPWAARLKPAVRTPAARRERPTA